MKRSILTLASALLCVAGQGQVTALTQVTTECEPKPYICFKLPTGATSLADPDGKVFDHYTLRQASTVTYTPYGSAEAKPLDFFVHIKQDTIVYFAHDMYYLPAKATVSVTVPALTCTAGKTQYSSTSTTYTATVADAYTVTFDTKASDIADKLSAGRSLIVVAPSVLTVDADLACKQLIVEGADSVGHFAAGVKVNSGATLAVADTAYYLCHEYDNRGGAYLINRGTYTAASNVFTKNVKHDLNREYGAKYEHWYKNDPNQGVDDPYYYVFPNIAIPTSSVASHFFLCPDGSLKYSVWFDILSTYLRNPADVMQAVYDHPTDRKRLSVFTSCCFRCNGAVNDFSDIAKSIVAGYSYPSSPDTTHVAFVDNDYPSAISLKSVVGRADGLLLQKATNAYVQRINLLEGSLYNFKTGLTTFDGPMQLGYLLPSMDYVSLIDVGSREQLGEFVVSKDDLCSYADMSKQEADVDVQYVRFYLDDANLPKGKGRRSVFVAYFLPSEVVDTLSSDDNPNFNGEYNKVWEAKMTNLATVGNAGNATVMPFVGADGGGTVYPIKMFAEPDFDGAAVSYEKAVKIFADPKQSKVEFGVLDYKLDNIYVECLGLVVNKTGENDIAVVTVDLADAVAKKMIVSESKKFLGQVSTGYLFNLNVGKSKSNAVAETIVGGTISIVAKEGGIMLSSVEACQASIFDVQGRLLTEVSGVSSKFVPLPSGVYVVRASSSSDALRKVVIVK